MWSHWNESRNLQSTEIDSDIKSYEITLFNFDSSSSSSVSVLLECALGLDSPSSFLCAVYNIN